MSGGFIFRAVRSRRLQRERCQKAEVSDGIHFQGERDDGTKKVGGVKTERDMIFFGQIVKNTSEASTEKEKKR